MTFPRSDVKLESPLLHSTLDMKSQLTDRVQLLRSFMLFLNNNLVAGQVSIFLDRENAVLRMFYHSYP